MRIAARKSHGAAGWRLSKKTPATAKAAPVCPDGKEPSVGDVRLLIAPLRGKPVAVLYRSKRPGDNSRTATEFSSPIGKTVVDQVELLRDAVIRTERGNSFYLVEFSLPLAELPPLANSSFYYDAGVIFSDASGSRNSFNLFHHSPLKGITADVPSEIRLTPSYMKKMTKFTKGNQQ